MRIGWFPLSILALASLSVMTLLITILTRKGYPTSFVLLGVGITLTIFYSLQTFIFQSYTPKLNPGIIGLLLAIGILSAIGNLTLFQAARDAPNPGLAVAIGAGMQSGTVALLALLFLKDKLTSLQLLGIFLGIVAILLINLGSVSSAGDNQSISKEVVRSSK